MNDLFLHDSLDTSPVVFSDRILYTPTSFAKTALLYLQEIGSLQAKKPHTSSRTHLSSYLFFCVNSGSGELEYQRKKYKLGRGTACSSIIRPSRCLQYKRVGWTQRGPIVFQRKIRMTDMRSKARILCA